MKKYLRTFLYRIGYKNSIFQRIYVKLMASKSKAYKQQRARLVNLLGNEVLDLVNRISAENHILIWPEFGTLLGAYRNQSFISYDPDIDLGIIESDYSDALLDEFYKKGCSLKRKLYLVNANSGERKLLELTLIYKGLCFDLFISSLVCDDKRKVYVSYEKIDEIKNIYKCKYYTVDYTTSDVSHVRINGYDYLYPAKADAYLSSIYGESFMTPIEGWIPPKENPIVTFLDADKYYVIESLS